MRLVDLLAAGGRWNHVIGAVERWRIGVRFDQEVLAHADAVALERFASFLFVADKLGADRSVRVLTAGLAVRVLFALGGAKGFDLVYAFARVRVAEVRRRAVCFVAAVVALRWIQSFGALLEADAPRTFWSLDVQHGHRRLTVFIVQIDWRNGLSHDAIAAEVSLFTAEQDHRCCQQQSYRPHSHLFCPPCDIRGHVFCHLT